MTIVVSMEVIQISLLLKARLGHSPDSIIRIVVVIVRLHSTFRCHLHDVITTHYSCRLSAR